MRALGDRATGVTPVLAALTLLTLPGWLLLPGGGHPMAAGALCAASDSGLGGAWLEICMALVATPLAAWGSMWCAMVLAMSPPLLARPLVVAMDTGSPRDGCAVAPFVLGYAVVWLIAGVGALGLVVTVAALARAAGAPPLALGLALAGVWQLTPWKRQALDLCHRTLPAFSAVGPGASLRRGVVLGVACVASCWLAMLPPMLMAEHSRAAMAVVAAFLAIERNLFIRPGRRRAPGRLASSPWAAPTAPSA